METNHTITVLTSAFDEHGLKYHVIETGQYPEIHVPFGINNGPFVDVRYISTGRGNDISVRIMNLVNKVPMNKRFQILETINALNNKYRFLKFNLDLDNDIHVEYDLPVSTGVDCLGEMSFEIFIRTMQILNEGYVLIAKALYAEETREFEKAPDQDLLKLLKDDHDKINITISKTPASEGESEG